MPPIRGSIAIEYTAVLTQAAVVGLLPVYVGQLLSEVLELDEFGRFYAFMSMVTLAVYFGGLGLHQVAITETNAALRTGVHDLVRGLRTSAPWLILGASVVTAVTLLGLHVATQGLAAPDLLEFAATLLLVPVIGVVGFLHGSAIPHGRPLLAAFLRDVLVLLVVVALVLALAFSGYTDLGVLHATAVYLCGYVGATIGLAILLRHNEPAPLRRGPRRTARPRWVRHGLTFSTSLLVWWFIDASAILYAKWALQDDDLAGRMASIVQIGSIPLPIAFGFLELIMPDLSRAIDARDLEAVHRQSRRFLRLAGPPIVIFTAAAIVFMEPILHWYGPQYLSAAPAATILVIASAISGLGMAASTVATFVPGLHRRTLVAIGIAIVCAASFTLVPKGSPTGLASVQGATLVTCTLTMAVLGHRRLRAS